MLIKWRVYWSGNWSGNVSITSVQCIDETEKFVMLKPGQRTAKRSNSEAYCDSFAEAQSVALAVCREKIAYAERKRESAEALLAQSKSTLLELEQLTAEEVKLSLIHI